MAFSLVEAEKLSQDMLQKGVINTMVMQSGVLQRLPFVEVVGNGYTYNVSTTLPEVGYRQVNEAYAKDTDFTVNSVTEALVILGGDADVDVFLQRTHSNINDLRAMKVEVKAKNVARTFEKDFFVGTGANKSLKGLDSRLAENIAGVEIKSALTLDALNELLDAVVDGADALFMSKKMRRELMKLLQESHHYIESGTDAFGRKVQMYGGVEIVPVDDSLIPAGKIYAVKFGADQYVSGLSNGGIQVRDLGEMESNPVFRTRIEFYCGLATKHTHCFSVLNTIVEGRKVK